MVLYYLIWQVHKEALSADDQSVAGVCCNGSRSQNICAKYSSWRRGSAIHCEHPRYPTPMVDSVKNIAHLSSIASILQQHVRSAVIFYIISRECLQSVTKKSIFLY